MKNITKRLLHGLFKNGIRLKENRKIIIVSPAIKMGGVERSSTTLANYLSKTSNQIIFISIFHQEHFYKLSGSVIFLEPQFNTRRLSLIKTIVWLRYIIKEYEPDVILVYNLFYGAIVALTICGTKIPFFVSDRGSPVYSWPRHINVFNKLAYTIKQPKGLVCQTNEYANKRNSEIVNPKLCTVIPNIVKEVKLYPEIIRKNQILAVGRLNDHLKGFDRLVKAFSLIRNNDWQLVFAGGDEDGTPLKPLAKQLGVLDRIVFLGKVIDIDRVYAEAGIFVIPSRSEGFPNSLCEAMAAGLPCVSYDFIAGPREILTDGLDGLIIENGNIVALAEALDYLISNPEVRKDLGKNAMAIRERLNGERISNDYLSFILDNN